MFIRTAGDYSLGRVNIYKTQVSAEEITAMKAVKCDVQPYYCKLYRKSRKENIFVF